MGYQRCKAVIAVCHGWAVKPGGAGSAEPPDVDAFRESLPETWRHLVVGPVRSVVNDFVTFAFLGDGSKEGFNEADSGDEFRRQFASLFSFADEEDRSSPFNVLLADFRWGGDEPGDGGEPELIVTSNAHRLELHPFKNVTAAELEWKLQRMEKSRNNPDALADGYRQAIAELRDHFMLTAEDAG